MKKFKEITEAKAKETYSVTSLSHDMEDGGWPDAPAIHGHKLPLAKAHEVAKAAAHSAHQNDFDGDPEVVMRKHPTKDEYHLHVKGFQHTPFHKVFVTKD